MTRPFLSTLLISVALAGCDNTSVINARAATATKVTSPSTTKEMIETAQKKVEEVIVPKIPVPGIKACDRQSFKPQDLKLEPLRKEFDEWLTSCDGRVQAIIKESEVYTKLGSGGKLDTFRMLSDLAVKVQDLYIYLLTFREEVQNLLIRSDIWIGVPNIWLRDINKTKEYIQKVDLAFMAVDNDPTLKDKLTGGIDESKKGTESSGGLSWIPTWEKFIQGEIHPDRVLRIFKSKEPDKAIAILKRRK